jgi:hypothetical protein
VGDLGGAEMSSSVLVTYGLRVNLRAPADLVSRKAEADLTQPPSQLRPAASELNGASAERPVSGSSLGSGRAAVAMLTISAQLQAVS